VTTDIVPTGWADDVARAAARGACPLVVAVCSDPSEARRLVGWLETAAPTFATVRVSNVSSMDVAGIDGDSQPSGKIYVVPDAAEGDEPQLRERWGAWEAGRDDLLRRLAGAGRPARLVLVVTRGRMPEISSAAPAIMALAEVITVGEEPFATSADDAELVAAFRMAEEELVERTGLTKAEVSARFERGDPLSFDDATLARWLAVIGALRHVQG